VIQLICNERKDQGFTLIRFHRDLTAVCCASIRWKPRLRVHQPDDYLCNVTDFDVRFLLDFDHARSPPSAGMSSGLIPRAFKNLRVKAECNAAKRSGMSRREALTHSKF
jgi:hypothetical protein